MEDELIAIQLKSKSGLKTIIDKDDLELLYLDMVAECVLFKDKQLSRCKKARRAIVHLKDSADKIRTGKMTVFESILGDGKIYSLELLFQREGEEILEEILVPYRSENYFTPNNLEEHKFERGLKITFADPADR